MVRSPHSHPRPCPVRPRVCRLSRLPLRGRRAEMPCTPGRLHFRLLRVGGSFFSTVRVRVRPAGSMCKSPVPCSHQRVSRDRLKSSFAPFLFPYRSLQTRDWGSRLAMVRSSHSHPRPCPVRPRVCRLGRLPLRGRRAEMPCTPGRLHFRLLRVGGSFFSTVRVRVRPAGSMCKSPVPCSHQRVSRDRLKSSFAPFLFPYRSLQTRDWGSRR